MRELFHRYFHAPEKRGKYERVNYSFQGDTFYSYYTAIGLKVIGRDKKPVLLISDEGMTPTTSGHISHLWQACPYDAGRVVNAPFRYGHEHVDIDAIMGRFIAFFLEYDGTELSRAANRRQVRNRAAAARQFSALVRKLPDKVMRAVDALDQDAAAIDDRKAGARKAVLARHKNAAEKKQSAAEKKQSVAEKKRASFLKAAEKMPYMNRIRAVYAGQKTLSPDQVSALREALNHANPGASFIWPAGDTIRTSQGISLPSRIVMDLIGRWRAGTLPVGSHIGPYTLAEVTPGYVRVGCHKIPTENIEALAAELATPEE